MTIVADPDVLHGLPRVAGTRISVVHVYDMIVSGAEPAEVAAALDLGRVYEALAYYYDNPAEMRRLRDAEEAALEELTQRTVDPPVEASDGS